MTSAVPVVLLDPTATLPRYSSPGSAGMDLSICMARHDPGEQAVIVKDGEKVRAIEIKPTERRVIKTGLAMELPEGTYGRIAPRSGLAVKKGLDVMAGVIDRDYTGEIGVVLVNLGQSPVHILDGERIAQLVVEEIRSVEVYSVNTLEDTVRGAGGFGSTGT